MIETEQTLTINAGIADVWAYAHDVKRWAFLMPGLQTCDVVDADNSRWTLKVGAGGMVRTVNVAVQVLKWDGPGHVAFAYKLQNDPVEGGGTYRAVANGPNATDVTLNVHVVGSGPMAPMWEAMGRPLLPTLARGFAEKLKAEIEQTVSAQPPKPARSFLGSIWRAIQEFWRNLLGTPQGGVSP